jgi:hypothetical protein
MARCTTRQSFRPSFQLHPHYPSILYPQKPPPFHPIRAPCRSLTQHTPDTVDPPLDSPVIANIPILSSLDRVLAYPLPVLYLPCRRDLYTNLSSLSSPTSSLSDAASALQCSGPLTMAGASSLETRHVLPVLFSLLLGRRVMEIMSISGSYPHGRSPSHSKASPPRGHSAARASTRSALVTNPPLQEIGSFLGQTFRDVCFLVI